MSQGIARRFSAEKALIWQIKASQHFLEARFFNQSNRAAHSIVKEAKSRGLYRLIIRVLDNELKLNPLRDGWLTYHYAHCCLIIGQYKRSLEVIKPLVGRAMHDDPSLKISAFRIYSEVLDAMGETRRALNTLEEVLASVDTSAVRRVVISQANAVIVRLLTKLEEYKRAERMSEEMFDGSVDKIGRAVALPGWGVVLECTGRYDLADDKLSRAVCLFDAAKDYRGFGWSLSHHAVCQQKLGNTEGAAVLLREALKAKSDIDEASEEYLSHLRKVRPLFQEKRLSRAIEAEIRRVSTQLTPR
jgi:tetratricopeptide (TPR) repeat protein